VTPSPRKSSSSKRRGSAPRRPADPKPQPFVVRRSRIAGRGAFAVRRIEAGEHISDYAGEHISQREGDRRYDGKPHTFLFELDSRTLIDGGAGGNDSRFINHSCQPNCEATIEKKRIVITATRRIRAGEEITYDYSLPRDKALGAKEDALYPCRCGARGCRGTLLEPAPSRRAHRRKPRPARKGKRSSMT
jgi:SET domain-containing protein